jgi:hypothetical protein
MVVSNIIDVDDDYGSVEYIRVKKSDLSDWERYSMGLVHATSDGATLHYEQTIVALF